MALTIVGASAAAQTSPSELQNTIMKMVEEVFYHFTLPSREKKKEDFFFLIHK